MTWRPAGTLRVLRLMTWTTMLRWARAAKVQQAKRKQKEDDHKAPPKRKATNAKRTDRLLWLILLMLPMFGCQSVIISSQVTQKLWAAIEIESPNIKEMPLPSDVYWSISRVDDTEELGAILDDNDIDEQGRPSRSQIIEQWKKRGREGFSRESSSIFAKETTFWTAPIQWPDDESRRTFLLCTSALLATLAVLMLIMSLGAHDATLTGGSWSQAWLMTFPVTTRSLVLARSLEYCLVQVLPWLTIGPLTLQFLGGLGEVSGTSAILIAIGTVVLTAFLVGGVRLWLETWLRMKFSLRTLRNIQSACMLTGMVLMACLFAVCMAPSTPELFIDICRTLPDWVMFLPGSWPIAMSVYGWLVPAIAVAVTAAAFWLTLSFTSQILRSGFMQSGGTDPGSRGASFDWKQSTKRLGIIGKDLLMLTRDRVLMVQTLAAPIFIIGLQVLINPSLGELGNTGAEIGYFIAVFSAMGGCFQVLSGEGRALWMLYTMPTPIAEMLAAKTRIWACIAVGFGCATLLAFAGNREELTLTALGTDLLLVGCGCWCVAHIAAGMRVLTANPAADHIPRQPKARHLYLFFFFGGSYLTVLVQPDLAQQLAGALIFATFSYAIWQRALDRIPWLLDPVDEPRKQLQVFDGGAALLVFFVLQAVIAILWVFFADMEPGEQPTSALTFAFMLSGAITVALFVSNLTRRGITLGDLFAPDARPQGRLASCLTGTVLGIALGGIGLLYLGLVSSNGWFEIPKIASEEYAVLFVLTVVAAPVIEEILFRGIVFGAFARSVRTSVAVIWSSLLFAAVHPVASWPPVFLMGLAAAILYRRSGFLPAAMLLHASYNFVVLTYQ